MELSNLDCTNIGTWVHDNDDTIYRFLVYRKMFTPKEMKECYSDESEFADTYYKTCKITNVIEVPNDVLLELLIMSNDGIDEMHDLNMYEYHKLSDIKLFRFDVDNKPCEYMEEDYEEAGE